MYINNLHWVWNNFIRYINNLDWISNHIYQKLYHVSNRVDHIYQKLPWRLISPSTYISKTFLESQKSFIIYITKLHWVPNKLDSDKLDWVSNELDRIYQQLAWSLEKGLSYISTTYIESQISLIIYVNNLHGVSNKLYHINQLLEWSLK